MHIRFVVDSGPRARFAPPTINGDLKLPLEKILSATHWRRWILSGWKPVTQARVRNGLDGIRQLYEKQGRLEAKVQLSSMTFDQDTNRARPTLEIEAGPRIEVRTIGAKVSQKRLRQYIPIFEEHTVDQELLVEGARNLRDYFQSEGYFETEVEPKQQRVTNDKAAIDYLVNTGKRHKLVHIEISGNRYFTGDALRERMFLQTANLLQFRHGRYSESLLRRDEDGIAGLYHSNGFRDVDVRSRIVDDYQGKAGRHRGLHRHRRRPAVLRQPAAGGRHPVAGCNAIRPDAQFRRGPALQRIQRRRGPRYHPGRSISATGFPTRPSSGVPSPRPSRSPGGPSLRHQRRASGSSCARC